MFRQLPARTFVGQKIHVQHAPASARTDHCGLFLESVLLDNIKRTLF